VTGVTVRNCYFEANSDTVAGAIISGGELTYVTVENNYFAGPGAFQTVTIRGSNFNQLKVINNQFDSTPARNPYFIGLENEAVPPTVFTRNLIIGNASADDAIPLFSPTLKTFADSQLYPNNAVTTNRVDHAAQYAIQTNFVSIYTVTMTPSTSGTITLEPTSNTGGWSKTGRVVHVQGSVTVASVSSPVGTSVLISLPAIIGNLDEEGEKIGGVVIQSGGLTILPFVGEGGVSTFNMVVNAASISATQTFTWSFSYITTSGTF
jgi:hypothetical protein